MLKGRYLADTLEFGRYKRIAIQWYRVRCLLYVPMYVPYGQRGQFLRFFDSYVYATGTYIISTPPSACHAVISIAVGRPSLREGRLHILPWVLVHDRE